MRGLRVELASAEHARLVWEWANDAVVRANSFTTAPIPWDEHARWWLGKLAAEDSRIWLLYEGERPVGQIRYARDGTGTAEVSFSVAADARGRGLGTALLRLTAPLARRELGVTDLIGLVKVENEPSQRAFDQAGYTRVGPVVVHGTECLRFRSRVGNGNPADG